MCDVASLVFFIFFFFGSFINYINFFLSFFSQFLIFSLQFRLFCSWRTIRRNCFRLRDFRLILKKICHTFLLIRIMLECLLDPLFVLCVEPEEQLLIFWSWAWFWEDILELFGWKSLIFHLSWSRKCFKLMREILVDLDLSCLDIILQCFLLEVFKVQKKQVVVNDVAVLILLCGVAFLSLFHDPVDLTDSFLSESFDSFFVVHFDFVSSFFLVFDLSLLCDEIYLQLIVISFALIWFSLDLGESIVSFLDQLVGFFLVLSTLFFKLMVFILFRLWSLL